MRKWSRLFVAITLGHVTGCQVNSRGMVYTPDPGGSVVVLDGTVAEGGAITDGPERGGQNTDSEVIGIGGTPALGGTAFTEAGVPSGGILSTGGVPLAGGIPATGGLAVLDGSVRPVDGANVGDVPKVGDEASLGGVVAMGGIVSLGGVFATGGIASTGGVVALGGVPGSGGSLVDAQVDTAILVPDTASPDLGLPDLAKDTAKDTAALTLVWSDEFEGEANTRVDAKKWTYVVWEPGQVNNELQRYTRQLENAFQDGDGNLVIRANYSPTVTSRYTSARLETSATFTFRTGRVEVRAKLPAGRGSFPGIVLMGESGNWPGCGELALMEQWGQEKNWFYATAYAGDLSGDTGHVKYPFANATTASEDFHVYSLDWQTDRLVFQVDGNVIVSKPYDSSSPFASIAEYLILDVAVGGTMGGVVDNSAFPMDMVVDYVRVYSY